MRVTTAFSRLLKLKGVWVKKVRFEPDRVVVEVALRRRRLHCPLCGYSTRARKDTRTVDSVWRHLDLGTWRLEIHCRRRRLVCPEHEARAEGVPFARPGSEFTRDFECLAPWRWRPATTRARSSGCYGSTGIRSGGSSRGCALMSSIPAGQRSVRHRDRRGVVAKAASLPHARGRPSAPGSGVGHRRRWREGRRRVLRRARSRDRRGAPGPEPPEIQERPPKPRDPEPDAGDEQPRVGERASKLGAISLDMGPGYAKSAGAHAPQATLFIDPYHVVQLANKALNEVHRAYFVG